MNQGKGNAAATMVVLVLLCSGLASADFKQCFETCSLGCLFGKENKLKCEATCLAKCIITGSPTSSTNAVMLNYCKFGCAVRQCTGFGSDFERVDRCVNLCGASKCSSLALAPSQF